MDENMVILRAHIDMREVDECTKKAERLSELLKEANSLADELASKGNITLSVEVEVES